MPTTQINDSLSSESPNLRRSFVTPKRLAVGAGVALTTLLVTAGTAFAQEAGEVVEEVDITAVKVTADTAIQSGNLVWIVIGAALVIFMQAGFAMVEVGFCRAKHAAHVVSTNLGIFFIGFVAFFLVGYPLMFGGYTYVLPGFDYGFTDAAGKALIGSGEWVFLWQGGWAGTWFDGSALLNTGATAAFFLYMVAFMDTTATIPTGSMAERWKFKSFVFWGLFCGAIYYPLFGAWTWGGGWLSQLGNSMEWGNGYTDFAGSGIVHATGGVAALAGAIVLGPRIGKFTKDGKPRALPGHNIPMAMLGTFILLFGWFGFNAASTFASSDPQIGLIAANTAIAGAFGGFTTMLWIWIRTGKPDPAMMANGLLAGLVIITAPCAFVDPWIAMVLGIVAGFVVVESVFFIERKLKVDDPVGAVSVHGVCGTLGVLAVGLVANGKYGAGWNLTTTNVDAEGTPLGVEGLFYGGGTGQLLSQLAGIVVLWTVMFGLAFAFFKIQNALTKGGIRSDAGEEEAGLDLPEMGVLAYPDFAGTHEGYSDGGSVKETAPA
jgi:Amt family ammonium transporter